MGGRKKKVEKIVARAGEYVVAEKGAADADGLRSPRGMLAAAPHDSSSSLAWDPAAGAPAQARAPRPPREQGPEDQGRRVVRVWVAQC